MTAPLSPDQIRRALELQALGRTRSQIAEELLRIDQADDPDDATAATALVAVAAAFDSAVSGLPEEVRELAREQVSKSLMELGQRDRTGG